MVCSTIFAAEADFTDTYEIDMVYVKGGTFTMGCTSNQGTSGTPSYWRGDSLPVERVKVSDAQEFITRLNERTGKNYRLPTEAEWEYAARGGSKSRGYKYSGSDIISEVAWYTGNGGGATHPVGTRKANELGIYDMSGNVSEWVNDLYGDYSGVSQTNPKGSEFGIAHGVKPTKPPTHFFIFWSRLNRGGGWNAPARGVRVSNRFNFGTDDARNNIGFRLALDSK